MKTDKLIVQDNICPKCKGEKVRYLLIRWINNNPVIDGCKHFDKKDECLQYYNKLKKIKGVEYTICETVNAKTN